jgi:hypothetical protein
MSQGSTGAGVRTALQSKANYAPHIRWPLRRIRPSIDSAGRWLSKYVHPGKHLRPGRHEVYRSCRQLTSADPEKIASSDFVSGGSFVGTQGRRWSDKLIDLWTCEVAAS